MASALCDDVAAGTRSGSVKFVPEWPSASSSGPYTDALHDTFSALLDALVTPVPIELPRSLHLALLTGPDLPPAYRAQLYHVGNMTPTLATFYRSDATDGFIGLRVLRVTESDMAVLTRLIALTVHATADQAMAVELAIIRIHLLHLPEALHPSTDRVISAGLR
jgi:hypothetical protein